MMTGNSRSETKGEFKVRSVLKIAREKETLSISGQEIYETNWYGGILYAFPLGIVYFLVNRRYQCKISNEKNSVFFFL